MKTIRLGLMVYHAETMVPDCENSKDQDVPMQKVDSEKLNETMLREVR